MKAISVYEESVQEFIKVLGLDSRKISRLEIVFTPDDHIYANVKMAVTDSQMKEMTQITKKYHMILEEIKEETEEV